MQDPKDKENQIGEPTEDLKVDGGIPSTSDIFIGTQQPRKSDAEALITMPNFIQEWAPRTNVTPEERVNMVAMMIEDELYKDGRTNWNKALYIDRALRLSEGGQARADFVRVLTGTRGIVQGIRNRLGSMFNRVVDPEAQG